jgi:hypothetical protein
MLQAPVHLEEVASPRTEWSPSDARSLEHALLAAENKLNEVKRLIESRLNRRIVTVHDLPPVRPTYQYVPPARLYDARPPPPPPPPAPEPTPEPQPLDGPLETSEATGARVMAAVKVAREQELQQRLPGGARRALARLPAGLYLAKGSSLELKTTICAALVAGAEGGRRSGESTIIDWDGEWPVVARRYGENGRIVYRVEQALRRSGYGSGEANETDDAESN